MVGRMRRRRVSKSPAFRIRCGGGGGCELLEEMVMVVVVVVVVMSL